MPVEIITCWEGVSWTAWWESGRGMASLGCSLGGGLFVWGKSSEDSKARRGPPSRERETWILVSLVVRERVWVRREEVKERSREPMVGV